MFIDLGHVTKPLYTLGTGAVQRLSIMDVTQVGLESQLVAEPHATRWTHKRLFPGVSAEVSFQVP